MQYFFILLNGDYVKISFNFLKFVEHSSKNLLFKVIFAENWLSILHLSGCSSNDDHRILLKFDQNIIITWVLTAHMPVQGGTCDLLQFDAF